MLKRLVLLLAVVALIASAGNAPASGNYLITLGQPAVVQGTLLKAGDYRLNLKADKITITAELLKKPVEATVKIETQDQKFSDTVLEFDTSSGKMVVTAIRLGGTKTKLVLN